MLQKEKKSVFNKILFKQKINKIKSKFWRNYWLNFFQLKVIIIKILCFILIAILVMGLSFGIRDLILNHYPDKIVLNSGVSFSLFENMNDVGVRLIQIIPVIGLFFAFLFVNDWYLILPIPFALFGGFSNFIDRFLDDNYIQNGVLKHGYNTVVDYISSTHSTFNIPDIFIVFGIVSLLIAILAKIIISSYQDEKAKKDALKNVNQSHIEQIDTTSINEKKNNVEITYNEINANDVDPLNDECKKLENKDNIISVKAPDLIISEKEDKKIYKDDNQN